MNERMPGHFDQILDDCLTQITTGGETVESCLARHPEHAADLEPYLRTAARLHRAYSLTPSVQCKEAGLSEMRAELASIRAGDQEKAKRKESHRLPVVQWRWAAATVPILLMVLMGGTGVVFASGSALPGDLLYPVKHASEQVRLTFQFSQEKKAGTYLAYAERRSQELSQLVQKGKLSQVEATQKRLQDHLEKAARIADTLQDKRAVAGISNKLKTSASQSLQDLQTAMQSAPQSSAKTASELFKASSQAYGDTVEKMAAKSATPEAVAGLGIVSILVIDPPIPKADKVLIEVTRIDAHRVGDPKDQWTNVLDEPQAFDLQRVSEVPKFLGERDIPSGTYTRVSLQITSATVVVSGTEYLARVPSERLVLTRPFQVEEGTTTVIQLDFNGARSIHNTGQGEYILKPEVNILAARPSLSQKQVENKTGRPEGQARESNKNRKQEKENQAVTPSPKTEFEGAVEKLAAEHLVVRGKRIFIDSSTVVSGVLEEGKQVIVEAVGSPDGSLLATMIVVGQGDLSPRLEKATEQSVSQKDKAAGQGQENGASPDRPKGVKPTILPTPRGRGNKG